jgi:hypothetical protein
MEGKTQKDQVQRSNVALKCCAQMLRSKLVCSDVGMLMCACGCMYVSAWSMNDARESIHQVLICANAILY